MAKTKPAETETNNAAVVDGDAALDTAFGVDKAAKLFGLGPTDVFACRDYGDRLVVVTTDGRRLEMAATEAKTA